MNKPDDMAWQVFSQAVRGAGIEAAKHFDQGGTKGTTEALMAVVEMLESTGADPQSRAPFLRLAIALTDLKSGHRVHPILERQVAANRGPKPLPRNEAVYRAAVAALLDRVIARKDFDSLEEAARWVARKASIRSGENGIEPWRKVQDWREAIRMTKAGDDQARDVFDAFGRYFVDHPRMDRGTMARKINEVKQIFNGL